MTTCYQDYYEVFDFFLLFALDCCGEYALRG